MEGREVLVRQIDKVRHAESQLQRWIDREKSESDIEKQREEVKKEKEKLEELRKQYVI